MKYHKAVMVITCLMVLTLSACKADTGRKTQGTSPISEVTGSATETDQPTAKQTPMPMQTVIPTPSPAVDLSLFAIQPQYVQAGCFNTDGYAAVLLYNETDQTDCFIIDESGTKVFGPVDDIWLADRPAYSPFCQDGKWGFINADFEVVIEPEYEWVMPFDENGYSEADFGGKSGLINKENEWVIDPLFDFFGITFANGVTEASKDGLFVLLDEQGEIFAETPFDYGRTNYSPETGLITYYEEEKYGLMNLAGEVILEPEYAYILYFGEFVDEGDYPWDEFGTGLYLVCMGAYDEERFGLVNDEGDMVFEAKSEIRIEFAENGLALVCVDGKYGYINADGEVTIALQYEYASKFEKNGLAFVQMEGGDTVYINEFGEIVDSVTVDFQYMFDYIKDGIGFGMLDDTYGIFTTDGECIFDSNGNYPSMCPAYGDDIYAFYYEDKSVYLDLKGNIIAEMPAGTEYYFTEYDTYLFRENDKIGIIDKDGRFLLPPQYDEVFGKWNPNLFDGPSFDNRSGRDIAMTCMYDSDFGPFGIISCDGEELIPPISESYMEVSPNGMVPIQVGDLWGYIQIDVKG